MAETRQVLINLVTRTGGAKAGITGLQKNMTGLNKGTVKAKSSLGGMNKTMVSAKRGLGGVAGGMGSMGLAAGAAGAGVLAVGAIVKGSISAFASFDDKMNQSVAIMGNVSEGMRNDMSNAAREMAKTTRFSADEAAESYFFLASAGLDAKQSIAALPAVAAFGQAGMFDMALATDLLTDAQSSLGLTVDDSAENLKNMTRVSDVFVKANTLANTSVQQVSEAITNKLGGALRASNIDIEEGVAVLAAYADQGLKGAAAGESFNIVLRDLKKVNRESADVLKEHNIEIVDQEGNFRNMADIVEDLEGAFMGLSVAEQAELANQLGFQDRSFKNIQLLIGQSDAIREYEEELRKAGGTTAEVADNQMQSFSAQMDIVKSKVTDAGISLGSSLAPVVLDVATAFGDMVEELGPLLSGFGSLLQLAFKFSGLKLMFTAITTAAKGWQRLSGLWDESARSATVLDDATKKLNATIEAEEDPTTDLANAMAHLMHNGELTEESLSGLVNTIGVSAGQAEAATAANLDWARSNGVALEEVRLLEDSLRDQINASERDAEAKQELIEKYGLVETKAEDLRDSWDQGRESAEALTNETGHLIDAEGNLIDATGRLVDAEGNLIDSQGNVIEQTLTLAESLAAAEDAQQSLADTMRAFADPTFAAIQGIEALETANQNLIDVEADAESSSQDVAAAQLEVAKAVLEAQGALDAFEAGGVEDQIGVIATALGISQGEAAELLETLGLIDGGETKHVLNIGLTGAGARVVRKGPTAGFYATNIKTRAMGGRLQAGDAAVVGERGPELFAPDKSGQVISNSDLTNISNQRSTVHNTINFVNPNLTNDPVKAMRSRFAFDTLSGAA